MTNDDAPLLPGLEPLAPRPGEPAYEYLRRMDPEMRQKSIAAQRCRWAHCWPEWEGPILNGDCQVEAFAVWSVTHRRNAVYYCALVRILEISNDGLLFDVEINYAEDSICRWMNGERLRLDLTDIWPPVDRLYAARLAGKVPRA